MGATRRWMVCTPGYRDALNRLEDVVILGRQADEPSEKWYAWPVCREYDEIIASRINGILDLGQIEGATLASYSQSYLTVNPDRRLFDQ